MGLQQTFASGVDALFAAFGDVPVSATYRRSTTATYDPSTGLTTIGAATATVTAFVLDYDRTQMPGAAIPAADRMALLNPSQLTAAPALEDQLVIAAGAFAGTWTVVGIAGHDAGVAPWELQIRRAE